VREGVDESKIYITGNTVIDALKTTVVEITILQMRALKNWTLKREFNRHGA